MTDRQPYDPDALAARLDEILSAETPPAENDPLIETALRLWNAPKPQLRAEARADILSQLLETPPVPAPKPFRLPVSPTLGALVAVAALTLVVIFVSMDRDGPEEAISPPEDTPTVEATTKAAPTATAVPDVEETPEMTQPALEDTPEAIATVLVIEGPVEAIEGNTITVFGVVVDLGEDNPLLDVIQVGDPVRVDGSVQMIRNTVVMTTDDVTFLDAEVYVNENTGQAYRDDGTCNNPPPDWAPAHGWRERCGGGSGNAPNPNGGRPDTPGQGKGRNK